MGNDPIWGPDGPPAFETRRPRLSLVGEEPAAFTLQRARLPDPRSIPPRKWLYGTHLLRGFVSVLVAPGGTGKSSYAMAVALCLCTGKKLLGEHVHHQTNAACLNLEDPIDELDRRLAALMIRHEIEPDELDGKFFMHSGEERSIVIAKMDPHGFTVIHPDELNLISELKANNVGLLVVDPFAESHSLEENSNPQMVEAAKAWRRVARACDCAILLVHHVRKGAVTDIDSARGAKALTDSARSGMLMSGMSTEEAKGFGIKDSDRGRYVRLDDAKANMAPKATKAKWFELERVELGNGTDDYPNGDSVAAIVSWTPPSVWNGLSNDDLNDVWDKIALGPSPGVLYTKDRRGKNWAGNVLMDLLGIEDEQAKQMIDMWVKNGLLVTMDTKNENRKIVTGLTVDDTKRVPRGSEAAVEG